MWPALLDLTKEESVQILRHLEVEAYSHLVSALRAQGPLNCDKRKLLKETSVVLNISQDRHKAEIRRAVSDEKLNTVAYHISGETLSLDDWVQEGRRCIPLLPRMAPQTAYSAVADDVADVANQNNKDLPSPSSTERKRLPIQQSAQSIVESIKSTSFRIPEPPRQEEGKKRKLPNTSENSSLSQHLQIPSKVSKIQQIYRQKTKAKTKEFLKFQQKSDNKEDNPQRQIHHQIVPQKVQHLSKLIPQQQFISNSSKVNVLQNINIQSTVVHEEVDENLVNDNKDLARQKQNEQLPFSSSVSLTEIQSNRPKITSNLKTNTNVIIKPVSSPSPPVTTCEIQKTVKVSVCPPRKQLGKTTVAPGQKLIVVSNAQTIPTTSILQKTLSIPFMKNLPVKNVEKFKIVSNSQISQTTIQTPTIATSNCLNSFKHKVVALRNTNSAPKKVIPLSQLQMLNSKGSIKVLPFGGKIIAKTSASATSSPLYIMNTISNVQTLTKNTISLSASCLTSNQDSNLNTNDMQVQNSISLAVSSPARENGNALVLEDLLSTPKTIITEERLPDNTSVKTESIVHEEYKEDLFRSKNLRSESDVGVTNDIDNIVTSYEEIAVNDEIAIGEAFSASGEHNEKIILQEEREENEESLIRNEFIRNEKTDEYHDVTLGECVAEVSNVFGSKMTKSAELNE